METCDPKIRDRKRERKNFLKKRVHKPKCKQMCVEIQEAYATGGQRVAPSGTCATAALKPSRLLLTKFDLETSILPLGIH